MMEAPSFSRYVNRKSKIQFHPTDSSASSSSSSSCNKKLKRTQVVPDIIDIDGDDDQAGVLFIGEKFSTDNMGKATTLGYDNSMENHTKVVPDIIDIDGDDDEAGVISIGEKFSSDHKGKAIRIGYDNSLKNQAKDLMAHQNEFPTSGNSVKSTSGLTVPNHLGGPCIIIKEDDEEDEALKKFRLFKQFDTVEDFSHHHYIKNNVSKAKKVPLNWSKTVQQEWKILEKDLPDTIFVRVSEKRMDLLRAVIIGAAGTPYHDGLFFFDVHLPSDYPNKPPQVYYHSGGLRINPNLYNNGKVYLSLLNTWRGDNPTQKWTPGRSTMLQVLLSIQALVLNAKPYFNEPGLANSAGTIDGERRAKDYTENTFVLSIKTMLYTLKRPPKHFEDFVLGHFRFRAYTILVACKAYIEGAQVGCVVGEGVQDVDEGDKSGSVNFKSAVGTMVGSLVPAFIQNGAKNCEQFIPLGDGFQLTQANPENIMRSSFHEPGKAVVGTSTNFNYLTSGYMDFFNFI